MCIETAKGRECFKGGTDSALSRSCHVSGGAHFPGEEPTTTHGTTYAADTVLYCIIRGTHGPTDVLGQIIPGLYLHRGIYYFPDISVIAGK